MYFAPSSSIVVVLLPSVLSKFTISISSKVSGSYSNISKYLSYILLRLSPLDELI